MLGVTRKVDHYGVFGELTDHQNFEDIRLLGFFDEFFYANSSQRVLSRIYADKFRNYALAHSLAAFMPLDEQTEVATLVLVGKVTRI